MILFFENNLLNILCPCLVYLSELYEFDHMELKKNSSGIVNWHCFHSYFDYRVLIWVTYPNCLWSVMAFINKLFWKIYFEQMK